MSYLVFANKSNNLLDERIWRNRSKNSVILAVLNSFEKFTCHLLTSPDESDKTFKSEVNKSVTTFHLQSFDFKITVEVYDLSLTQNTEIIQL
jgi:hypothetical protein